MPFAVGILLLIGGIVKLQNAIDMKRLGFLRWKVVLFFALLLFLMGGLLIYNPFEGRGLLVYIGVSLILDGHGEYRLHALHRPPDEAQSQRNTACGGGRSA